MELLFRSFVLIALLTLSGTAGAVGMGAINVSSALGEPLNAEIDLGGIGNKANKNGDLTARIASPEVFKGADLDYPYTLPALTFAIESRANGQPFLRITSRSPVNDPFVTLLVELNWPSGRLLREYTFLLDPPGFRPERPVESRVSSLAPIAATHRPNAESVNISSARIGVAPVLSSSAPEKPAAVGRTSSGKIIVKRGDTLRKIAQQAGPPDVSLERMLVALYRANTDEFDGNNMNRIRVGQILRMPSDTAINKVTQAEAMEEIRVQTADWDAYRHKLAAASITPKEPAARQEISGKINARIADIAPARESSKEVVKLSKGEMPGDKSVAGNASKSALQDRLAGLQEELTAKDIRLKDNSSRIALLEKNIKEMQHLIELKSQTMASAKVTETKPEAPAEVPVAKPAAPVAVANEAQPAKPEAKPVAKPQPAVAPSEEVAEPSMMDEFLGNPLYVGGFVAVLLALGGGWFVIRRNRTKNQGWGNLEKSLTEPVVPAVVAGETTSPSSKASEATPLEEEIDPISEADLFLNFGRDTQAEEILKEALGKDPNNLRILLKLLSIYQNRKDARTFSVLAQHVRDLGDAGFWAQAAAMGRKLEPDNPAYAGESDAENVAEIAIREPAQPDQAAQNLDFDLDFFGGEKPAAAANAVIEIDKPADSSPLDFDLGALTGTGVAAAKSSEPDDNTAQFSIDSDETASWGSQSGFIDLTSKSTSLPVGKIDLGKSGSDSQAEPAKDDFIDITSQSMSFSIPGGGINLDQPGTASPAAFTDDEVIDITSKSMSLSLPIGEIEIGKSGAASEPASADEDFIDITSHSMSLSLPVGAVETLKPGKAEEEASADEDFIDITSQSMSFTMPGSGDKGKVAPAQSENSLFHGIDLNLGEPASGGESAAEVKGEHWAEVATKIDLAKAYQEMGDTTGAREILKEVIEEGDARQRATAESMLGQLAS